MKKYCIFALILVLTLTVFTGCGRRRQEPAGMKPTDEMTIAPTAAPTAAPTTAPTEHTAAPTENATQGSEESMIPEATNHAGNEATTHIGTEAGNNSMDNNNVTENNNTRARTVR